MNVYDSMKDELDHLGRITGAEFVFDFRACALKGYTADQVDHALTPVYDHVASTTRRARSAKAQMGYLRQDIHRYFDAPGREPDPKFRWDMFRKKIYERLLSRYPEPARRCVLTYLPKYLRRKSTMAYLRCADTAAADASFTSATARTHRGELLLSEAEPLVRAGAISGPELMKVTSALTCLFSKLIGRGPYATALWEYAARVILTAEPGADILVIQREMQRYEAAAYGIIAPNGMNADSLWSAFTPEVARRWMDGNARKFAERISEGRWQIHDLSAPGLAKQLKLADPVPEPVHAAIIKQALTGAPQARPHVLELLGGTSGWEPHLAEALRVGDDATQLAAAQAMRRFCHPSYVQPLRDVLDGNRSQKLQFAATEALAAQGEQPASLASRAALLVQASRPLQPYPALDWVPWADLDVPTWDGGSPVPEAVTRWLVDYAARAKNGRPSAGTRQAVQHFRAHSLDGLADALVGGWLAEDVSPPSEEYARRAAAKEAADMHARHLRSPQAYADAKHAGLSEDAMAEAIYEELAAAPAGTALDSCGVLALGAVAGTDKVREAAERYLAAWPGRGLQCQLVLEMLAEREDAASGALVVDATERFAHRAVRQHAIELVGQMAERAGCTRAELGTGVVGAAGGEVARRLRTVLHQAILAEDSWSVNRWRRDVAENPALDDHVRGVVWQDGGSERTFRIGSGGVVDVRGEAADVPAGRVRVAHATTVPASVARAWGEAFSRDGVEFLVPQFSREPYRVDDPATTRDTSRMGWTMLATDVQLAAQAQGYGPLMENDDVAEGWIKDVPGTEFALVTWTSGALLAPHPEQLVAVTRFVVVRPEKPFVSVPFGDVPKVLLTEGFADYVAFANIGEFRSDWRDVVFFRPAPV